MSDTRKNRRRATKLERLRQEIENCIYERERFLEICRTTADQNEKRIAYYRAEVRAELIAKYQREIRDYQRRKMPPEPQPLFKFNNKEI